MVFNAVEDSRLARSTVAEEHELESVEAQGRVKLAVVLVHKGDGVVAVKPVHHGLI